MEFVTETVRGERNRKRERERERERGKGFVLLN